MNTKEMYDEVAALLGAVGKAFGLEDAQAAQGLEDGSISLEMAMDAEGKRYVRAGYGERFVRIYDGRVFYEGGPPDQG